MFKVMPRVQANTARAQDYTALYPPHLLDELPDPRSQGQGSFLEPFSLSYLVVCCHDGRRRCCRAVDFVSDGHPKLILVDKELEHHVVHAFRLGTVDRPAY